MKVLKCGVTLEDTWDYDHNKIYYLEAMTKKTGNTWNIYGQNIKGFALLSDEPENAIICNIKNNNFVG